MSLIVLAIVLMATTTQSASLPDIDKLWDYQHPDVTEKRFVEILPAAEKSGDRAYLVELLTQIARAQGRQERFDEAHATLDRAETMLTPDMKRPRVRYLLERGRAFNSSGQPDKARPLFENAWRLADKAGEKKLALDAVHMIAIVEKDPAEQVKWNLKGIAMVEADPSQRGWLPAFYNNLGEAYAKLKQYDKGLDAFQKMADVERQESGEVEMYTLKDESRMLRALRRLDEAAAIMKPIVEKLADEKRRDGWISAEYAECLLASNRAAEARKYFADAYELLKDDAWLKRNDRAMLERLERQSKP